MKLLKKVCSLCLIFILPFILCSCKNTKPSETKSLYGVLIYQDAPGNDTYQTDKNNIKTLISVNDSKFSTDNLFSLYFNCEDSTNTNTTHILNEDSLSLEIYLETTEISTCLIYKDKDGEISYSNFKTTTILENDTTIYSLNDFKIIASKNLSHKKG